MRFVSVPWKPDAIQLLGRRRRRAGRGLDGRAALGRGAFSRRAAGRPGGRAGACALRSTVVSARSMVITISLWNARSPSTGMRLVLDDDGAGRRSSASTRSATTRATSRGPARAVRATALAVIAIDWPGQGPLPRDGRAAYGGALCRCCSARARRARRRDLRRRRQLDRRRGRDRCCRAPPGARARASCSRIPAASRRSTTAPPRRSSPRWPASSTPARAAHGGSARLRPLLPLVLQRRRRARGARADRRDSAYDRAGPRGRVARLRSPRERRPAPTRAAAVPRALRVGDRATRS
jgi:hypothetical protein